jgi:hypothetical protein
MLAATLQIKVQTLVCALTVWSAAASKRLAIGEIRRTLVIVWSPDM